MNDRGVEGEKGEKGKMERDGKGRREKGEGK